MSQSGREQPDEAQTGTGESIPSLSDSVLTTLDNRLKEFGNIAVSVSVMNQSITALRTELDELKSQKSGAECRRELAEQPQSEPPSKRARTQQIDNENGSEDQDPIDAYMQEQDDGDEMDESEEEDLVSDLSQFFTDDEEMGPKIEEELAMMANSALRAKPQPDKLKKLAEKYKRPENLENLQVPKVDEILWRQLRKDTKAVDYLLQKVQSSTALALIPIIKAVGILHTANKNKEIKELKELIIDSFKILSLNMTNNHEIRRETIKRELDPKYKGIGNKEPSTTKLFGDQLQETIKTMGDSKVNLTINQTARKSFLGKRRGE